MKFNNKKFLQAFIKHFGKPAYTAKSCKGITRQSMYKLFNEGNPNRDTLYIVCQNMGVPMESFFTK